MRKPVTRHFVAILMALAVIAPSSSFAADEAAQQVLPDTLYIIPFLNVMVPSMVSSPLFDSFIDAMLKSADQVGVKVRILKQDIDAIDKDWLAQQHFVTGEVFDYVEDSGCCSTELEAKVRIYRYRPGTLDPAAELLVADGAFFDHDLSSLEKERSRLGNRMAGKLAGALVDELLAGR